MWFCIGLCSPTPPLKRVYKNRGPRPEIGDFWHGFAAFRSTDEGFQKAPEGPRARQCRKCAQLLQRCSS